MRVQQEVIAMDMHRFVTEQRLRSNFSLVHLVAYVITSGAPKLITLAILTSHIEVLR